MDLDDPWLLARAWVLAPLVIAIVCLGLGAGLAALTRRPLGLLTAPAGYLTGMVVSTALLKVGVHGDLVAWLIVALAAAGGAGWAARRMPFNARDALWPTLAALAAFGIAMAPLVLTGRSGVLGYVLNNDSAIHLAVIELLRDYGTGLAVGEFDSSFEAAASLINSGYPLGTYAWPLVSSQVAGLDPFHLWTPTIAVTIAMLALVALAVLRLDGARRVPAALAAPFVATTYLLYSFHAQGSLKEVATALAVYGMVALGVTTLREALSWRTLLPPAIAAAAAVAAFGVGAGAWLVPGVLVALVLVARWVVRRRPSGRAIAVSVGVLLLVLIGATPTIADSIDFVRASEQTLRNPAQFGNLLGPVPWREGIGIWLSGDYRRLPADHQTITNALQVLAVLLGILGGLAAVWKRAVALPLALASGLCGAYIVSSRYSAYLDTKSFAVLAPALGMAVAAGVIALWSRVRWAGAAAGAVMALGCTMSIGYAISEAWPTPEQRFEELADIDERFAGQGPMLVNEREQYAVHLLRRAGGWESWNTVFPSRGFRAGEIFPPPIPHTPDFDEYSLAHYANFNLLLERRRPGGSRPPSGFEVAYETPSYRVWERTGELPREHLDSGLDSYTGVGPLDCARPDVVALRKRARTEGGELRVAAPVGTAPVIVQKASDWQRFVGTHVPSPVDMVTRRAGFASSTASVPAGRYVAWVQGAFWPGIRVKVDGREIGGVNGDLGLPDSWHRVGEVTVGGGLVDVETDAVRLPRWRVASRHLELSGPLVFEPVTAGRRVVDVSPKRLADYCGKPVDWLELAAA
jgi:hypothetical protein